MVNLNRLEYIRENKTVIFELQLFVNLFEFLIVLHYIPYREMYWR